MFIMIDGDLLSMSNISAVTPAIDGPGCVVQFVGGGARFYTEHGVECFAQAIIAGSAVYYVENDHEC